MLAAVYDSPDLSYYCLAHYDMKNGTTLADGFVENAAK
jgi:hypothetical protein